MDAIFDIVEHFNGVRYEDLPEAAVDAAKKELLDSLATALGGSGAAGVGELVDVVGEWGGKEQSTIIAYGEKCPAPCAAQVNGTMIHALDYDDGHQVALVHIGCTTVSTCLAVAERVGGVSGKEFLTTMALGADLLARLGLASCPGKSIISTGWHPTTLFGYLGTAAMAGRLMKLDEQQMVNAIGIAYHQCAGNTQCGMDGALTKRMGPGLAARGGITSALMAERGITGVSNVLEGKAGLYNLYFKGDYDRSALLADLGTRFEGVGIGDKPYPCCGFTHAFIDIILDLLTKHTIKAEQIRKVTAYGGESSIGLCQPAETKTAPQTIVDAQFSLPWTIATALVKGKVTLEDFTEKAIKNEAVLKISRLVTGVLVPAMNRHGVGPGKVTITMQDGREYTGEEEHCKGSIERPMTFEDCARKFRECAESAVRPLAPGTADKVISMVRRMERWPDATEIMKLVG